MQMFMDYDWPGNIRELQNVLESAMNRASGDTLEKNHFIFFTSAVQPCSLATASVPLRDAPVPPPYPGMGSLMTMKADLEYAAIRDAMLKSRGNKTQAAALLGISRNALYKKLKKYR